MLAPIVDLVNWLKFPESCSLCQHPESETIFDSVDIMEFHILFDINELFDTFDKPQLHAELHTLISNKVTPQQYVIPIY